MQASKARRLPLTTFWTAAGERADAASGSSTGFAGSALATGFGSGFGSGFGGGGAGGGVGAATGAAATGAGTGAGGAFLPLVTATITTMPTTTAKPIPISATGRLLFFLSSA